MSDLAPWVFCGNERLPVPRADLFLPPAGLPALEDVDAALGEAFATPLGAPRLRALARGARSVAITVPDGSRPCPTPLLLRHVLTELQEAGVPEDGTTILVGCGLHAPLAPQARARLTGLHGRVRVLNAHALESPLVDLGQTTLGAPVHVVREVAQADLTITLGVVEPHLYAGFSGGVKGVAIGCAGQETIAWTHRPAFISLPGVGIGRLVDNPFQQTLQEAARRTSLAWAVNVVMNEGGRPAAVAAGDPARVQATLAARHAGSWLRSVGPACDVLVAGVHAPKSDNFYQASRAATYACLGTAPALRDGGLLVLCADLPDGAGDGPAERNFIDLLRTSTPAGLVGRGLREPLGPGGQRAFVVARVLERFRLAVVGRGEPGLLRSLGQSNVAAFDSVGAAVASFERDRPARVLAVADAMTTVARSGSSPDASGQKADTTAVEVGE